MFYSYTVSIYAIFLFVYQILRYPTLVYWFNPLVWMAAILSKRDSELACGETTIALLGEENRLKYGRTLVGMMSVQHKPTDLFCGATTMTGG